MSKAIRDKAVYRIIDANNNRASEGLRVCEEIARFVLGNKALTARFKGLRHQLRQEVSALYSRQKLLAGRDSAADIGRTLTTVSELRRGTLEDVYHANIQRVKESLRVLEEFTKLIDTRSALAFKRLRYRVYGAEKKT